MRNCIDIGEFIYLNRIHFVILDVPRTVFLKKSIVIEGKKRNDFSLHLDFMHCISILILT